MPVAEIVVLGAGPAGAVAASELARRGFRVLLISRAREAQPSAGECLAPGIRPLLEAAGMWDTFLSAGHMASSGIRSYWGSDDPAERHFLFSPYREGWHIDRPQFDAMCRDAAVRNGCVLRYASALRHAVRVQGRWRLFFDGGLVETDAVIDATGRASAFARCVGARRRSLDHLIGVAGYFSAGAAIHPSLLLIEAAESGWWYSAPLPGGKLVVVYMTDADLVRRERLASLEGWMTKLAASGHHRDLVERHACRLQDAIRVLPAETSFLDRVAGEGWLAAGDAAAAFDPLSSQGIASAITSGLDAAGTLAAWLGGDEGAPAGYAHRLRSAFAAYLANREIYYRMEARWPESNFWSSRAGREVPRAGREVLAR
jgi:flavin-dependent dehydrogenase